MKKLLEQGIEQGIYERVPEGEPVTWCSPLVVQPKPKYAEVKGEDIQPNMIRACIDLRIPNSYMQRSRITKGPTIEDFTYVFNNCTVFSKMDMNQGYHQLELHPDSRPVATFCTPWGNLRPK